MRKEIRRIVMFCTILTVGLLLLVFDVTFIQLLFLIIGIALILPFLLGLVTIAEVREVFSAFKEQKLKKISILKKLDDIKLFEKKGAQKQSLPQPKPLPKAEPAPGKGPAAPGAGGFRMPFASQISSLVSSFSSFGTVLKERMRRERKVEDINKMLDKTVAGKVEPAPAAAVPAKETSLPAPPGGAGSVGGGDADPFLSLSEDDFDAGLLDGLDEDGETAAAAPAPSPAPAVSPGTGEAAPAADMGLPEPELSVPSPEIDAAASDILKAYGGEEGLDAFSGLDAGAAGADADLGELDNLSLDDVEIDDEDAKDTVAPAPAPAAEPAPAAAPAGAPAAESSSAVKTAWIPSDAPKDADQPQDQIGTQSDMASFAQGATGTDEDLLSSIASDVKHTVKEKDLSLLRELKDFKAPANQIETELTDMYQRLSAAQKPKDKGNQSTNEIK